MPPHTELVNLTTGYWAGPIGKRGQVDRTTRGGGETANYRPIYDGPDTRSGPTADGARSATWPATRHVYPDTTKPQTFGLRLR